jgi:hypothetical protein
MATALAAPVNGAGLQPPNRLYRIVRLFVERPAAMAVAWIAALTLAPGSAYVLAALEPGCSPPPDSQTSPCGIWYHPAVSLISLVMWASLLPAILSLTSWMARTFAAVGAWIAQAIAVLRSSRPTNARATVEKPSGTQSRSARMDFLHPRRDCGDSEPTDRLDAYVGLQLWSFPDWQGARV